MCDGFRPRSISRLSVVFIGGEGEVNKLKPRAPLDHIVDVIQIMRLEAATENRKAVIESLVEQIIRIYESIHIVTITPDSRDQAIRLLHILRCLRRDYVAGGFNCLSPRLPILMTIRAHREADHMDSHLAG
jgi:hypothetical protein